MCEVPFLFGLRQEATLIAVSASKCCVLHKGDFLTLQKEFPDILHQAQSSIVERLRQTHDPLLDEVERTQTKSDKQIAQLADLLFAAAAGKLDIVAEAIMHGGATVADADYEGRTALHIAASANQLAVVEFLVQQKGNVNGQDNFGKTPLSNAMHHGHVAVIKVLRDAGGKLGWAETETAGELFVQGSIRT